MRHNFVNDIGDYGKYALLRALSGSAAGSGVRTSTLGVIWYLTEHSENNGDGRRRAHLSGDGWDGLDPELLREMRRIEAALSVRNPLRLSLIEQSAILPAGTRFFSEALPHLGASPSARRTERAAWFERALAATAEARTVFVDPDNGLEVPSVPPGSRLAGKYATALEVTQLLSTGSTVVLYQHGSRVPWAQQRRAVCQLIASAWDRPMTVRTFRFGAFGSRAFFCVSTRPAMVRAVDSALARLNERIRGSRLSRYVLVE
jgi:hypothetical protein